MARKVEPLKKTPKEAESAVANFMVNAYATLVDEIEERIGYEEGRKLAYDAYHKFVTNICTPNWEAMKGEKPPNAQDYVNWLVESQPLGYDIDIIEESPDSVQLRFNRCLWATQFIDHGKEDTGLLFCEVDDDMIKEFNEITGANLVFERTKVLMDGCDHCNHHIYVKK